MKLDIRHFIALVVSANLVATCTHAGMADLIAKAGGKTLRAAGIVVASGVTAYSLAEAVENVVDLRDMDRVMRKLREQGADDSNNAIFSLYYTLKGDAKAVMWADVFSKPDVFAVVEIEGEGQFLIPEIKNDYAGQPILQTFLARHARPGSKVAVYLMDDDSVGDELWNSILAARLNLTLESSPSPQMAPGLLQTMGVKFTASGSIQLLQHAKTIDSPDFVAAAVFTVPEPDGTWSGSADLLDQSGNLVGSLSIKELRSVPWQDYDKAIKRSRTLRFGVVMFGVFAVCGAVVFGKLVFSKAA